MEFINDAVSKTKEMLEAVSKKTEDAINMGKLKYEISSLEKKREKNFATLGKLYFELIENGAEPDGKSVKLVEAIRAKNEKIEELNAFVKTAKDDVVCPECEEESEPSCEACDEENC